MSGESENRLERLIGVLRRRGVIIPAFEIHGGSAGFYDFGPIGGRLRNRVNQMWIEHWLALGNVVELSCPTITPFSVLEASGHVAEFSDFIISCLGCKELFRADHLIEGIENNPDAMSKQELAEIISCNIIICPECSEDKWSEITTQNLMFNTKIGSGKSGKEGFLRPETAQGMFTNFKSLYRHFRQKLPFGAIQVGKGYRNEISPRQGMIRLREFNMAELEYFIDPSIDAVHDFSKWDNIQFNLIPDPATSPSILISPSEQTPQTTAATTRGMIVIFRLFRKRVPIHSNLNIVGPSQEPNRRPRTTPSTIPQISFPVFLPVI